MRTLYRLASVPFAATGIALGAVGVSVTYVGDCLHTLSWALRMRGRR